VEIEYVEIEIPLFNQVKHWLDLYFSGKNPSFTLPLHRIGTPFQKEVWNMLCTVPYGKTITYGELAKQIAQKKGLSHMSAQAIGRAVGKNPISIVVPCHRVVGAKGTLTGYAAGIEKKEELLKLEGIENDA
ncbi:MAG: methylated-DNA--[protein]-cysteine S-methyltransferase, partial [Erysipelotrichaceae bacterium]|nr:methylated-DNA--[protein]-cysteine S-methyltransferase [Erysipelotrichaceae bacterium]